MTNSSSQKLAIIAYIAVCILWGSTYLATRIIVLVLPPFLSAGFRFTIAGIIMFGYARFKRRPMPDKIQWRDQSIIGALLLTGANGMIVLGSQWMDSGIVALLFATAPLFIGIGETILGKGEKLTRIGWGGLIVGFGGVVFLVLGGRENLNMSMTAVFVILLGSFLWAAGSVVSKGIENRGAIEYNIAIQMLSGGAGLTLIGLLLGQERHISYSLNGILAILYLIVFGSLLGYNAYIYLLSVWPAARAGTYAYVNPFVAILLGYLILDEPLSIHVFLGIIIILLGVFMVQFSGSGYKVLPLSVLKILPHSLLNKLSDPMKITNKRK